MDLTTFKHNLRLLIDSRGKTVKDLAYEINIPQPTLSRYLTGDREPQVSYVVRIAEYFNVSVDWLLGLNGDKFEVFPKEIQQIASLYSVASPDDRHVIQAVLNKYKEKD